MSVKYKNSFRGYLIDHHSPEFPVITFDRLEPKEYEDMFKKANLDMLMVYCKDHFGNAYYDTKVGRKHPALKIDYVQAMKEICQRNDMEFMAYYSVGLDKLMADRHSDWCLRDEKGNIARISDTPYLPPKWPWMCGNTPYRNYTLKQLIEIVNQYKPDTLFLDIFHFPVCYCEICQDKFSSKYNILIPKGRLKEKYWREFQDFQHQNQYDFAKAITKMIRSINPDIAITVNGGFSELRKELLGLMDYTFAEPSFGKTYLGSAFAEGTGICPQIGPGTVSYVYDPQKPSYFTLQTAYIASQGCRPFIFCGCQHTDGSLDKLEFENLGIAYGEVKKYQKYLTNRKRVRDIGIIYSENSRLCERDYSFGQKYGDSLLGAIESAAYTQYPYGVIPEWKVTRELLKESRVIFLSNLSCMSSSLVKIFKDYVQNGGILVSTHKTSLCDENAKEFKNFQLADVFGCDFIKVNKEYITNPWGSYLNRLSHPVWEHLPNTELAVSSPFIEVTERSGEVLAKYILPCLKLTAKQWVNWWSPPWKEFSHSPAIIINYYGRGKSIYLSFDLFGMVRRTFVPFLWPKEFISALVQFILPDFRVMVRGISRMGIGTTYFSRKDKSLIVHQVNHTVKYLNGEIVPLNGGTLYMSKSYFKPKECLQVYPKFKRLKVQAKTKGSEVRLPMVDIHNIILVR